MLREKSQSQKDIHLIVPFTLPLSTNIITKMENRPGGCQRLGVHLKELNKVESVVMA